MGGSRTEVRGRLSSLYFFQNQIDVVDTFCRPALKEEDSCKEVTRKACAPSDKVVDRPSGKIPEFYASDKICRPVPKATCEAHTVKVPKTTCEPVEAKFYHHFW